jgi:hypothetical protein
MNLRSPKDVIGCLGLFSSSRGHFPKGHGYAKNILWVMLCSLFGGLAILFTAR